MYFIPGLYLRKTVWRTALPSDSVCFLLFSYLYPFYAEITEPQLVKSFTLYFCQPPSAAAKVRLFDKSAMETVCS